MLSSEAGAALLITGRLGLVSLLQVLLPAVRELVLVVVKLVTALTKPIAQAVHIKK
jgi:hypothetical protein